MIMKRILTLTFLFCCLGLRAANPSFTDLLQTNITWVAKNGNDTTGRPGQPAKPYLTLSNAVQASLAPAIVKVAPGLYNESVLLKNGVNLEMPSGVIVSQSVAAIAVLFDDGNSVTSSISGSLKLVHTGNGANACGILLSGASAVSVDKADVQVFTTVAAGIKTVSGSGATLKFNGTVRSASAGLILSGVSSYFNGEAYGTNDYGIIASELGSSNYITGVVGSMLNSAIHIGDGFTTVEDCYSISFDNTFGWALEQSGGAGLVKDSQLVAVKQEAIGKYGGTLLRLSSCMLTAGTNVTVSIDNDGNGSHGDIEIQAPCWANKPANAAMNITSGSLVVSNTTHWKNPQVFKSVHNFTNIVARTNGNTWFPEGAASFSTIATNQIPATGWTNNAEINVTVLTTATAVSFTINNRAGTVLYTSPTLTATVPVNLQPGWSVRAASGLTGTVLPF
jgi:hypothetical protein